MSHNATALLSSVVFDPIASKILGRNPDEIKKLQDDANIAELEAVTTAVEGNSWTITLKEGPGGWTVKVIAAAEL